MNTKYIIQDREAGNFITDCQTMEEAKMIVESYYAQDIVNDCFTPDFYEIVEMNNPQSKDTVPEMEWDLYPGNEAGAFDHLDNEQFNEDMAIKALEEYTVPVQVEGFTGGEWKIDSVFKIVNIQGEFVANCMSKGGSAIEDNANAKRIVTCVNNFDAMYAALKELLDGFEVVSNNYEGVRINDLTAATNGLRKAKAILNTIDNK